MKKSQLDSIESLIKSINQNYTIYADGSCRNNPGRGGYAYIILEKGKIIKKGSKSYKHTTNNRMELIAVIEALKTLPPNSNAEIYLDSKYVVNAINERWLTRWTTKNFQGVKNQDLWKQILNFTRTHKLTFNWVKAHNGDKYNELCDKMARKASNKRIEHSKTDKQYETYMQNNRS